MGGRRARRASSDFSSDFDSDDHRKVSRAGGKRKRVNISCMMCRQRKIKCDGNETCGNCRTSGKDCVRIPVPEEENRLARLRKEASRASRESRDPDVMSFDSEHILDVSRRAAEARAVAPPLDFSEVVAINRRPVRARKIRTGSITPASSPAISPVIRQHASPYPSVPSSPASSPALGAHTPIEQYNRQLGAESSLALDTSRGALERMMSRTQSPDRGMPGRKRVTTEVPAPLVLSHSSHLFAPAVPSLASSLLGQPSTPMQHGLSDSSTSSFGSASHAFSFAPIPQYDAYPHADYASGTSTSTTRSPVSAMSAFTPFDPSSSFDWRGSVSTDGGCASFDSFQPAMPLPPPLFAWHSHGHDRSESVAEAEARASWAAPRGHFFGYPALAPPSPSFDFFSCPDTISMADITPHI